MLRRAIDNWVDKKSYHIDSCIYTSDLDFDKHFTLRDRESYIETVFECIEGQCCGFDRNIIYDGYNVCDGYIMFNFNTNTMDTVSDEYCLNVLNKYKLSIYTFNFCITNSPYVKDIMVYLFITNKKIKGLNYIFKNLVEIISDILPYHIKQTNIINNNISLPFSHTFFTYLPIYSRDCKLYYSQIESKEYAQSEIFKTKNPTDWSAI